MQKSSTSKKLPKIESTEQAVTILWQLRQQWAGTGESKYTVSQAGKILQSIIGNSRIEKGVRHKASTFAREIIVHKRSRKVKRSEPTNVILLTTGR